MTQRDESISVLTPLEMRLRVTAVYRYQETSKGRMTTHTGYVTIDITRDGQRQVALRTVRMEHLGQELAGIVQDEIGLEKAMMTR